MVNFGPPETVPERFRDRKFYQHNPTVTLMRTTAEENAELGDEIGRKVAAATGPAAILLPLRGVSAIDREGQPFDDPRRGSPVRRASGDSAARSNCWNWTPHQRPRLRRSGRPEADRPDAASWAANDRFPNARRSD